VYVCGTYLTLCSDSYTCDGLSMLARRSADGTIPTGWGTDPPPPGTLPGEFAIPDFGFGHPAHMSASLSDVIAAWTRPVSETGPVYGEPATLRVMRFSSQGPTLDAPRSPADPRGPRLRARWVANVGVRVALSGVDGMARLGVYDVVGRQVSGGTFPAHATDSEITLPGTADLRPGLYFVGMRALGTGECAHVLVTR